MLSLVPSARVAHIGLYRDPETLTAIEYYFKAPSDVAERLVLVLDPMLATANSAIAAVDKLKERVVTDLRFVCLLAAPEGITKEGLGIFSLFNKDLNFNWLQTSGVDHPSSFGRALMKHQTITIQDASFHVVTAGQGMPLLFIHGWPDETEA